MKENLCEVCNIAGILKLRNNIWICIDCCDRYDNYTENSLIMTEEEIEGYR